MAKNDIEINAIEVPKAAKPITVATIVGFLVGLEDAINALLRSRSTVWIGLLFVISAGFAREYDGESLLHEPWHLVIPLGASLVTSLLLFSLLALVCRLSGSFSGSFWSGYRHFLGLYWMTAPLAWLYAIPIERMFSPAGAVRGNLMFLAIVSLWRVVLITRVVSVVFKCHVVNALVLVMLFADTVALAIIYFTPMPIFNIMGGIRLTESEQVIQSAQFMLGGMGLLSSPLWLIGALIILIMSVAGKKPICVWKVEPSDGARVVKPVWIIAVGSIVGGATLLPFSQPEQYNRWQVQHAFAQGRIDDGIRYMAERQRSDFPPHWDPPPRIGYGETRPTLMEVIDRIELSETKGWARVIFIGKLRFQASESYGHSESFGSWFRLEEMSDERLRRYVRMLESLPDGDMIAWSHQRELERSNREASKQLTPQRRELFLRLAEMAYRHRTKRNLGSGIAPDATESPVHSPEVDPAEPADQPPQSDAR